VNISAAVLEDDAPKASDGDVLTVVLEDDAPRVLGWRRLDGWKTTYETGRAALLHPGAG